MQKITDRKKTRSAVRLPIKRPTADTVLVTGASGRLGRQLCEKMIKSGLTVRCLINQRSQINDLPARAVPYIGDITNAELLKKACEGADAVYHLAAIVSQRSSSPREIIRVNALGTTSVLEAAEFGGVGKFVFPSTVDVYGRVRHEVLTEESKVRPTDMYGHSKMLAERQIMRFGGRMSYTILRMAAMYGNGFEGSFFKVFKMIKEHKAYIIGNGANHLSLVHVSDVMRAMMLAKDSRTASYRVYNLSDGRQYTQTQLLDMAAELLNVEKSNKHANPLLVRLLAKKVGIDLDELRFITSNRVLDTSRIRKELGFIPRAEIRKSTKELVEAFLNQYKNKQVV